MQQTIPQAMRASPFISFADYKLPKGGHIVFTPGEQIVAYIPESIDFPGKMSDAATLFANAPDLLMALQSAQHVHWIANAAITDDIEALRRICLGFADWWNNQACPAINKARGKK